MKDGTKGHKPFESVLKKTTINYEFIIQRDSKKNIEATGRQTDFTDFVIN